MYCLTLPVVQFNVKRYARCMKVQKRTIGHYEQLYITLPAKICQAMDIGKGAEIKVSVAGKDSLLLKVAR